MGERDEMKKTDEQGRPYTWAELKRQETIKLYAGGLFPGLEQYDTHIGLCNKYVSERCILHDLRNPLPLGDNTVSSYQAEDVFEHIEYRLLPPVFDEIYRVLQPGALFRLSVPDYRCDVLRERSFYNYSGRIVFDPWGGGTFDGLEVTGGHVWFPLLEDVLALFGKSRFDTNNVTVLHGYIDERTILVNPIDYSLGHIKRTPDHDPRVSDPYRPMSIVIDAYK